MILAAVMIVAAIAAVSIPSDDSDAADALAINSAQPIEMSGVVPDFDWFLNIQFNQAVEGNATYVVVDAEGNTIINTSSNIKGAVTSLPLTTEQAALLSEGFTLTVSVNSNTITYSTIETPGVEYCTITITQPANGTITVTGEGYPDAVVAGTVLTATIEADEGYTVNGQASWTVEATENTEIVLPEGTTIVEDEQPETYKVTIIQPANGTIAVTGADDLDAVEAGTELTAIVTAAEGYEIQRDPLPGP